MSKHTQDAIIKKLNDLKGYEGYVQFSHKVLETMEPSAIATPQQTDDFFLVEAHYYSKEEDKSIAVRYYADAWYWDETNTDNIEKKDKKTYKTKCDDKAIFSQVWIEEDDKYCNNWKVKKLKKVLFTGLGGKL